MKQIIVMGSLNMDLTIQADRVPVKGETLQGFGFFMNGGGKGANQAAAAAKISRRKVSAAGISPEKTEEEVRVLQLGAVGRDLFGQQCRELAVSLGIDISGIQEAEGVPTGVAMIILSGGDNRILLDSGANFRVDIVRMKKDLCAAAQAGDILATQFENQPQAVYEALHTGKQAGMYTVLNPAPAPAELPPGVLADVDLLILNQSECQALTGRHAGEDAFRDRGQYREAARCLREQGASDVLITLGKDGSICFSGQEEYFVPACRVEAVDTTGAGDTFIGSLLCMLAEGKSMPDAMRFATKASALAVGKRGAVSSIPEREEVEAFQGEA